MKKSRLAGVGGTVLVPILVIVVICGGLAAAIVTTGVASHNEARAMLAEERSFQLAEAGVDWMVAELRRRGGKLPDEPQLTMSPHESGDFVITVLRANTNGIDDDGDGVVDNDEEGDLVTILSTGRSDRMMRTLEVVMRESIDRPVFSASTQLNVDTPILDLKGNAFIFDGREHFIDGSLDPAREGMAALASGAPVADLIDQIDPKNYDQIIGVGGTPSVDQAAPIDLSKLVEQAARTAEYHIEPGTHSGLDLGTPTKEGVVVAYCEGDLHLSGSAGGAGLLAIDGDVRISGSFEWVGIVFVRGRVTLVGGGGDKRVIGALVVGEEVTSNTSSTEIKVTGTVDVNYSSDAIQLAIQRLATLAMVSWREVGNPDL